MQSDDRITGILELLSAQRDQFRSAVAEASEQLRALVSVYRNGNTSDAERAAFELGRFARGRRLSRSSTGSRPGSSRITPRARGGAARAQDL